MRTDQLGANSSCLPNTSLKEAIDLIRNMGFHGITLLAFANTRHRYGNLAGFWFRDMNEPEQQELKGLLSGFDRRALHAPFVNLPVISYDPKLEQLAHDRIQEAIDAAEYLGCQVVIVHPAYRQNYSLPEYWDHMVAVFKSLGEYAGSRGVKLGIETGFPTDVDQFVDLLEAIGHHAVGATLDCGHMLRYVDSDLWGTRAGIVQLNNQLMSMVRQLGILTVHVQLHDVNIPEWADHRAIGRGGIDFEPLLVELDTIGYQGMLEFELEEKDGITALKESKRRIEALIRQLSGRRKAA
ncbi:MAG: sugar phosphate isomerase/epimerase family protein [Chloroflexota bacterium]